MASLLDEIAPEVAQLAKDKGLRVADRHYDPSSFGNAVIEMSSDDFELRVVRDRGEVALEISPPGKSEWHILENVLAFISKQSPSADPASLARSLSVNFEKVAVLMTSDLSKVGFSAFEKRQSDAFLQKLFPPS